MSMTILRDSYLASFFSIARILRFCSRSSPIDALKYILICLRAENDLSQWEILTTIVIDILTSLSNVGKALFSGSSLTKTSWTFCNSQFARVFFASTASMHTQSWAKLYRVVRGFKVEASKKVFDCELIEEIAFMILMLLWLKWFLSSIKIESSTGNIYSPYNAG